MKLFLMSLLVFHLGCYAQNKPEKILTFKGEHYALYNKCLSAVTFCELTQQTYTSCGSVKNCYGLYVLPGDTFYINIEDKNQSEVISADISFAGYFPSIFNFIFKPIDANCEPQQALQIAIPLTAVTGSSFQIVAQNTMYVNNSTMTPTVPLPFNIYVGGQQPAFTFALGDFTTCPNSNGVSVKELKDKAYFILVSPNPANGKIQITHMDFQNDFSYVLMDCYGKVLISGNSETNTTEILLNGLGQGLYFISFYCGGKLIETQKIIQVGSD